MLAVDTNLLVYAHRQDAKWHAESHSVLLGLANGRDPWAIPWPCVHEFLAIVTHPRIYKPPTPLRTACAAIRAWMASPSMMFIGEGTGYFDKLETIVNAGRVAGGAVHDARIVAICQYNGVIELWSADRDFTSFHGFKVRNPLFTAGLGSS